MKSYKTQLVKVILFAFLALSAVAVHAQNARIQFDNLKYLETKANEIVEVNIDGKLLDLAKRVMIKVNDQDAKKVGEAIKGLEGIYVRVYKFDNDNEYNPSDIDQIRSQLQTPGWAKLANVRSKKNNQKIDVFTMFTGDTMSGLAVVISENKSIALVNVIGPIDIDLLAEMSGRLNIPKIDIEKEEKIRRTKHVEQKKNISGVGVFIAVSLLYSFEGERQRQRIRRGLRSSGKEVSGEKSKNSVYVARANGSRNRSSCRSKEFQDNDLHRSSISARKS